MEYSLLFPTPQMEAAHRAFLAGWEAAGLRVVPWISGLRGMDYKHWLRAITRMRTAPAPGRVPSTLLAFTREDGAILGYLELRHELNDYLLHIGGHIGYGLVPQARGQGLAPVMLGLSLPIARGMGLSRVLVTCNAQNLASAATIRHCGGQLENEVADATGGRVQRYWIKL